MRTLIYFIRHAESEFIEGLERTRGLTDKGKEDAILVRNILTVENIEIFISSPYRRAIDTILPAADMFEAEVILKEDLKERQIGNFKPLSFLEAKRRVYDDYSFCFPLGESSEVAQARSIEVMLHVLKTYKGKKIAIGTHGDIMTLIINYFDKRYSYAFWQSTSMPDIYKMEFEGTKMLGIERLIEGSLEEGNEIR